MHNNNLKELHVYTDGSCHGFPGDGGWAYIILDASTGDIIKIGGNNAEHTSSTQMKLTALNQALRSIPADIPAVCFTDDKTLYDGVTKYLSMWKERNYTSTKGKEMANRIGWEALSNRLEELPLVSFEWINSHAGHPLNHSVDILAKAEAEKARLNRHYYPNSANNGGAS